MEQEIIPSCCMSKATFVFLSFFLFAITSLDAKCEYSYHGGIKSKAKNQNL